MAMATSFLKDIGIKNLVKYDSNNELGRGQHSVVYKGYLGDDRSTEYAVKIVDKGNGRETNEVNIYETLGLNHPHIIKIVEHDETEDGKQDIIVMELCEHTFSVFEKPDCDINKQQVLYDAASALDHLHSENILHCDLKPGNFLLKYENGRWGAKLCDFGLSVKQPKIDSVYASIPGLRGTFSYMPREGHIVAIPKADKSWDVFAFGLVMHYVITNGIHPFGLENIFSIIVSNIVSGNQPDFDALVATGNVEFLDLLKKMLSHEKENRPIMRDVLKDNIWNSVRGVNDSSNRTEAEESSTCSTSSATLLPRSTSEQSDNRNDETADDSGLFLSLSADDDTEHSEKSPTASANFDPAEDLEQQEIVPKPPESDLHDSDQTFDLPSNVSENGQHNTTAAGLDERPSSASAHSSDISNDTEDEPSIPQPSTMPNEPSTQDKKLASSPALIAPQTSQDLGQVELPATNTQTSSNEATNDEVDEESSPGIERETTPLKITANALGESSTREREEDPQPPSPPHVTDQAELPSTSEPVLPNGGAAVDDEEGPEAAPPPPTEPLAGENNPPAPPNIPQQPGIVNINIRDSNVHLTLFQ